MLSKLPHLRNKVVAYLALFFALGGTAVAALGLASEGRAAPPTSPMLVKVADAAVVASGGEVGYRLTVSNASSRSIKHVALADRLPVKAGLSWHLASPVGGCAVAFGVLGCAFDRLEPGVQISVHVVSSTTTASCGSIANTAYAAAEDAGIVSAGPVPIAITCPPANAAPTIVTPATASPNPTADGNTQVSALCADDGGEGALAYAWSASGPAAVSFGASGTNAAKTTTAALSQPGSYTLTVTCTDAGGLTASSSVAVDSPVCALAPTATLVEGRQHFAGLNAQRPTDSQPILQPIDIVTDPVLSTPSVNVGDVSTPTWVPVPFYVGKTLTATVSLDYAAPGNDPACGGAIRLRSATLTSPSGSTAALTSPAPALVADGGTVSLSFTPDVGDQVVVLPDGSVAVVPGSYQITLNLEYGRTLAQNSAVSVTPLRIVGRCGKNTPVADFAPADGTSIGAGTPTALDGSGSFDLDNVSLVLVSDPVPGSSGCGLSQSLAYGWSASSSGGFPVTLDTSTSMAALTPSTSGDSINVRLVVTDSTGLSSAPVTHTFPVE